MTTRTHSLGFVVASLHRRIVARLSALTEPQNVMPGHFPVLRCLRDLKVSTQVELARIVGVEQPSMAATLMRMEKAGLIQRVSDETDGRKKLVSLTPQGRAMLVVMTASALSVYREAKAGLTEAEVGEFLRIARKMTANLEVERDDGP
jgi:DNA-binding MarR family transcriptional regulator